MLGLTFTTNISTTNRTKFSQYRNNKFGCYYSGGSASICYERVLLWWVWRRVFVMYFSSEVKWMWSDLRLVSSYSMFSIWLCRRKMCLFPYDVEPSNSNSSFFLSWSTDVRSDIIPFSPYKLSILFFNIVTASTNPSAMFTTFTSSFVLS